jgi:hypothetical protein
MKYFHVERKIVIFKDFGGCFMKIAQGIAEKFGSSGSVHNRPQPNSLPPYMGLKYQSLQPYLACYMYGGYGDLPTICC